MMWARIAAGLGVLAMLYAMYWGVDDNGYERGRAEVQADWNEERRQVAEELLAIAQDNQRVIAELEGKKNENLETIAGLRVDLARARVRVPQAANCGGSDTSSGSQDPTAGAGELSASPQAAFDRFRQRVESLAHDADTVMESCRVVMDWAKGAGGENVR